MAIDPEELAPRSKKHDIVIGEDLSALSARELELRIATFEDEIARHREAIKERNSTRSAADAFFKK